MNLKKGTREKLKKRHYKIYYILESFRNKMLSIYINGSISL